MVVHAFAELDTMVIIAFGKVVFSVVDGDSHVPFHCNNHSFLCLWPAIDRVIDRSRPIRS
jgi:hypothetical protein